MVRVDAEVLDFRLNEARDRAVITLEKGNVAVSAEMKRLELGNLLIRAHAAYLAMNGEVPP